LSNGTSQQLHRPVRTGVAVRADIERDVRVFWSAAKDNLFTIIHFDGATIGDRVLVVVAETTSNVAVSGKTIKACAKVSTQNWHSTSTMSSPVPGAGGVFVTASAGEAVAITFVPEVSVLLNVAVSAVIDKISTA
jgi:hypothetical protein